MIRFILGEKGSGKTKWLIDNANKDMKEGNGNIAFIDVDDDHIFSLNYNVRLINASEYDITSVESLYGFLCGVLAMDYDLEKIYVDSMYKVIDLSVDRMTSLRDDFEKISEKYEVEFYINVDHMLEAIPEELKNSCIQIEKTS